MRCDVQAASGNLFALCNRLSQPNSDISCVDITNETFTLQSIGIPDSLRVPESVQGIRLWPTPDAWLRAVKEKGQHRNFFTDNFSDAYSLGFPPSKVTVCTVRCQGFELRGGTLELGAEACIVLNGRGENDMATQEQIFTDVTIGGAHCTLVLNSISHLNVRNFPDTCFKEQLAENAINFQN